MSAEELSKQLFDNQPRCKTCGGDPNVHDAMCEGVVMSEERQPDEKLQELTDEMLLCQFRWAAKNWLRDDRYQPLRAEILRRMGAQKAPDVASGESDGWIKCSERLPDKYEDFLVWIVNDQFYARHPDIMTFDPQDKSWGPHPEPRKDSNVITHWRELPAPPEKP